MLLYISCCSLLALRLSVVVLSFDGLSIADYIRIARWILHKRLYLILCIFSYYIIYNSNAHFVLMIWIFVHDRKICSISHFKAFYGLLASGSIITLDAQKNAVCAICIFYTLQYSMVLLYFCNLSFTFGIIMLQMQQKIGSYMRILDRIMYIDILFRYNNSYVCNTSPPLVLACIACPACKQ